MTLLPSLSAANSPTLRQGRGTFLHGCLYAGPRQKLLPGEPRNATHHTVTSHDEDNPTATLGPSGVCMRLPKQAPSTVLL